MVTAAAQSLERSYLSSSVHSPHPSALNYSIMFTCWAEIRSFYCWIVIVVVHFAEYCEPHDHNMGQRLPALFFRDPSISHYISDSSFHRLLVSRLFST